MYKAESMENQPMKTLDGYKACIVLDGSDTNPKEI